MIGKKNVVFGFIFLVFTAALGPVMVKQSEDIAAAQGEKQNTVGRLQNLKNSNWEEDLDVIKVEDHARANTDGVLSLNKVYNSEAPRNAIKGGPHAHGNLEALLNIVVGIALCFIAVSRKFKQAISWIFIAGTLLHSGLLYLIVIFDQYWAYSIIALGPVLILLGLLLAGVAAAMGFQGKPVED